MLYYKDLYLFNIIRYSSPGRVIESSSGPKKPYVNPRTIITELSDIKGLELDKDAKVCSYNFKVLH